MTEEELVGEFNPDLKKKKKKKALDLDEQLVEQTEESLAVEAKQREPEELVLNDDEFDLPMKKKKKKKSVTFPKPEAAESSINANDEFALPSKKKKKKKSFGVSDSPGNIGEYDDSAPSEKAVDEEEEEGGLVETPEAEYKYDDLLKRVYDTLKARNPDYVAGERRRFVMKPPEVVRVSARKTAFANFTEIVKLMHRQQDHVMAFMLAELGTTGTLDGNQQLVVKARFQQKQIENVLRRYIREYVTCHTCKSPNTILTKEDRLFYLTCETCHARCTVAPIKSGYVAFTGRRSAQRRAMGM